MKKVYKILLITLSLLALVFCSFLIYVNINTEKLKDITQIETEVKAILPRTVKINGLELYTQPDPYTCGVTTISTVVSFLNKKDTPPQHLIEKYSLSSGMSIEKFKEILKEELQEYKITYQNGQGDSELIKTIHKQLQNDIPIPVFFGAPNPYNKPYNDFHASVVTGIDLENQVVDILNVYGYEEHIPLVEFLNRMSYRGTKDYPIVQRAVLKLGLMDKNSIFIIEKK